MSVTAFIGDVAKTTQKKTVYILKKKTVYILKKKKGFK